MDNFDEWILEDNQDNQDRLMSDARTQDRVDDDATLLYGLPTGTAR